MPKKLLFIIPTTLLLLSELNHLTYKYISDFTLFELLSNFRLQVLIFAFAFLILTLALKSMKWSVVAVFFVLINGYYFTPFYPSLTMKTSDGIRIITANVLYTNFDATKLVELVEKNNADILNIQELTPEYATSLESVKKILPYCELIPARGGVGIGIYSKTPLESAKKIVWDEDAVVPWPSIYAKTTINEKVYDLLSVHIPPPNMDIVSRNKSLDRIAEFVRLYTGNLIISGDFNLTPFSADYEAFLKDSTLISTRTKQGLNTTWPSFFPAPMRIPIDHIFIKGDIINIEARTLDKIGSDHLPYMARIK